MKIISGLYKGRILKGYTLDGTRPTMDRVKESLFAMIQNNISNSLILDLFSGSGNLGIEALSNGASYAYLVDKNPKAVKTINANIKDLNISNAKVLNSDYQKALESFSNNNLKFDLIFLDPPYETNYIEKSLELIATYNLLNEDGLIICESNSLDRIIYPSRYKSVKEKKYGDKWVVILK